MKSSSSEYEAILLLERLESLVEELDEAEEDGSPAGVAIALRDLQDADFPSRADLVRKIADLHSRLDSGFDEVNSTAPL